MHFGVFSWNALRSFQFEVSRKVSLHTARPTGTMRANETKPLDIVIRPAPFNNSGELALVG